MSGNHQPEVMIIAAEASSSLYALRLLQLWKKQKKSVHAFGIGSHEMEAEGFEIIGRSESMAVVGIQEVVAHLPEIRQVFHRLVEEAKKRKPKFVLLLDYPEFNFKLAAKMKEIGVPVVYYISPQLWAWRKGRIKLVKKFIDKMLVLFPFEVDFYKEHQVKVEFVGHPLLDEMSPELFLPSETELHRSRFGLKKDSVVLGLMPGSRRSEIKHHFIKQLEVARKLYIENPAKLSVVVLVAPGMDMAYLKAQVDKYDFPLLFIQTSPMEMLQVVDVVLCASGTATLVTALMKKPMVIMYIMNSLTAFLAKILVKSTPYFGMVNLIMKREICPERFQENANVEELSDLLRPLLFDKKIRESKINELSEVEQALGAKGATERVAKALEEYFL